jgi:hypothetical protein
MAGKSKYVEKRILEDRRTTDVRGVTGYDRRKRSRRTPLNASVVFAPGAPRKHAGPQADDLDFTNPKQKQ